MTPTELVRLYPKLWHMADADAWPLIVEHGLLSTAALTELFQVPGDERERILAAHRPRSVRLHHPQLGVAMVRDQKPLSTQKLQSCLTGGASVREFLLLLNSRVFFWLQENRLERLLNARAYRGLPHLIIEVDTARLLASVGADAVSLSRINSGSTVFRPVARGLDLFKPIADYAHAPRRRALASGADVAELCVLHSVPDILAVADHAVVRGPTATKTLWSA